jgi:hypothetical protein
MYPTFAVSVLLGTDRKNPNFEDHNLNPKSPNFCEKNINVFMYVAVKQFLALLNTLGHQIISNVEVVQLKLITLGIYFLWQERVSKFSRFVQKISECF